MVDYQGHYSTQRTENEQHYQQTVQEIYDLNHIKHQIRVQLQPDMFTAYQSILKKQFTQFSCLQVVQKQATKTVADKLINECFGGNIQLHNLFVDAFIHNIKCQSYQNDEDFFEEEQVYEEQREEVKEDEDRIIMDSDDSNDAMASRRAMNSARSQSQMGQRLNNLTQSPDIIKSQERQNTPTNYHKQKAFDEIQQPRVKEISQPSYFQNQANQMQEQSYREEQSQNQRNLNGKQESQFQNFWDKLSESSKREPSEEIKKASMDSLKQNSPFNFKSPHDAQKLTAINLQQHFQEQQAPIQNQLSNHNPNFHQKPSPYQDLSQHTLSSKPQQIKQRIQPSELKDQIKIGYSAKDASEKSLPQNDLSNQQRQMQTEIMPSVNEPADSLATDNQRLDSENKRSNSPTIAPANKKQKLNQKSKFKQIFTVEPAQRAPKLQNQFSEVPQVHEESSYTKEKSPEATNTAIYDQVMDQPTEQQELKSIQASEDTLVNSILNKHQINDDRLVQEPRVGQKRQRQGQQQARQPQDFTNKRPHLSTVQKEQHITQQAILQQQVLQQQRVEYQQPQQPQQQFIIGHAPIGIPIAPQVIQEQPQVQDKTEFVAFGSAADYESRFKEILKQYLRMKYAQKRQYLHNLEAQPGFQEANQQKQQLAQQSNLNIIQSTVTKIAESNGLTVANPEELSLFISHELRDYLFRIFAQIREYLQNEVKIDWEQMIVRREGMSEQEVEKQLWDNFFITLREQAIRFFFIDRPDCIGSRKLAQYHKERLY